MSSYIAGREGDLIGWAVGTANHKSPFREGAARRAFEFRTSYEAKSPRAL